MGTTADKLQAILNSKAAIKTAINNKGGSLTDSTPLDEYATAIGNIQTPTLQSKTANPSTSQQTITPDVGYNGLSQVTIDPVTASIDANIQAGNIKKDVTILGVTGTLESGGGDIDKLIDRSITTITSNVTKIGYNAFYYCTSLTSATFPNVTKVWSDAFNNCTNLSTVDMPNVTQIDSHAFDNCTNLTNLYIPNVTSLGQKAFGNCINLSSITIPNLTSAADYVFNGCKSLVNVDLNTIPRLGYGAFGECTSLQSITLRRTQSVVTMAGSSSLPASSTQHITIYVPSNLIASYQTATNWSTFYNNGYITFVAIS